jgi:hypothetical protein
MMMQLPAGVRVRRSAVLPTIGAWLSGRRRPMSAVTIRHTITVHPDRPLTNRLLRWTFPLRYTWNHLRHGHRGNPYEIEARKNEVVE